MSGRAARGAARPKRAGEEFARNFHSHEDGPSSKKLRFDVRNPSALAPDAPEEDAILELDEIGKSGQQTKRNAVNLDGYESDSSNEGFDARADAKAELAKKSGQNISKEGDDNDMFADLEEEFKDGDDDEDLTGEGKKKRKEVRFLEESEIEGQVENSTSGGHVAADFSLNGKGLNGKGRAKEASSSSDSEEEGPDIEQVDEEVGAGGKKKHAPTLDAFNMKSEMEEGRFDDQGNYVRKAVDPDSVHDSWLEGVSKKEMKKAKEAHEKREQERRDKSLASDQILTSDLLANLITRLDKGETTLEALARLNRGKEKKKPKWQTKNKNRRKDIDDMEVDTPKEPEDAAERKRREAVEAITEAADELLARGQPEIYEHERELLLRQYRRETGEDWNDPPDSVSNGAGDDPLDELKHWEYRWSDARDGGESHGPYDGSTMIAWNDAGYFGDGVEFRRAGSQDEWSRSVDFV